MTAASPGVTLDRPDTRNAQNKRMTYELNAAFDDASRRSDVKVIVLDADGPPLLERATTCATPRACGTSTLVTTNGGFAREGQEGHFAWEDEVYFQMCWRWRNIPKPVVAAAQGKTIAGGLMLLWVADIIIAADDAQFVEPDGRDGRERRGVLRPPVGARAPQGQGAAVHRRLADAPTTPRPPAW